MQRYRKEACRNFQRGFCQYGERCKFLHQQPQPQQPQPQPVPKSNIANNPFGFGGNIHQQPPHFKPFDNKWSRSSPASHNSAAAPSHRQQHPNSKSQPMTNHECTDPESCKRLIAEDFQTERPLWKLTCYGHWKGIPCDISGDISYEELRAAAYDDAKNGLGLPLIVERERNLLNLKLLEFENLLHDHHKSGHGTNSTSSTGPGSAPPSVSSFSQLGVSLNLGAGLSPSTPPTPFGLPNLSSPSNQIATTSGIRPPTPVNNALGWPNSFPNLGQNQSSSLAGITSFQSLNPGSLSSQIPQKHIVSSTTANVGSVFSSAVAGFQPPTVGLPQNLSFLVGVDKSPHQSAVEAPSITNAPGLASASFGQASASAHSVKVNEMAGESDSSGDASGWRKEKWIPGEIPEQAPPDVYIY